MSILVVCPRYAPDAGGIETLLGQLLPELAQRGYEFVVAAGTDRPEQVPFETIDGIPVHRIPFGVAIVQEVPKQILEVSRRIRAIEEEHGVTVRHVQGFGDINLWYAMRAQRRRPLPLAVSVHGTFDWLGHLGPSARELLGAADVITAVSEPVRTAVEAELEATDAPEVRLIRNGLRYDDVLPTAWPERGYLLGVGRLLDQKGFDVAVEALAHLSDSHPELELVIAGGGPDLERIRAYAERWGVASRVRMLGAVPRAQIGALLEGASIAVVPSRHTEGFSLAALEAAHAARPVIASAVGGLVETVEDGITGVLVPPDRPVELARAIARMIDDPEATALMGKRGYERAADRFSFATCVDEYARLYDDLAAIASSAPSGT